MTAQAGIVMRYAFRLLLGMLLPIAGYWLKEMADDIKHLHNTMTDMRIAIGKMETNDSNIDAQIKRVEHRLERLKRKAVKADGNRN